MSRLSAPGRLLATGRNTASNRQIIRDFGTALSFDGVNDYVDAGNNAVLNIVNNFSFSLWINPSDISSGKRILLHGYSAGNKQGVLVNFIGPASTNLVQFHLGNGTKEAIAQSNTSISVAKWSFWVGTYDGVTLILYRDGITQTTTDTLTSPITYFPGDYLAFAGTVVPFQGSLDEVRIYNRALSAPEIGSLYRGEYVSRVGLVGEWLFNEGAGTTALDTSGNNNTGTINGGAVYTSDVYMKQRVIA